MYIATQYIGGRYAPGDPLPDDLDPKTLAWLIKAGAVIEETDPKTLAWLRNVAAGNEEAPRPAKPEPEAEAPKPETIPEPETVQAEAADQDEIDEDAVAPEIDVMEGIVAPEKPKKRRGGKKA